MRFSDSGKTCLQTTTAQTSRNTSTGHRLACVSNRKDFLPNHPSRSWRSSRLANLGLPRHVTNMQPLQTGVGSLLEQRICKYHEKGQTSLSVQGVTLDPSATAVAPQRRHHVKPVATQPVSQVLRGAVQAFSASEGLAAACRQTRSRVFPTHYHVLILDQGG